MSVAHAKGEDLEAGPAAGGATSAPAPFYPKMTEDPRLRWAFIRKVYAILAAQLLFTAGVASVISFVRPIPVFFLSQTPASWAVFFAVLLLPFIVMWPMLHYRERHPINLVLLAIFTFCISLSLGIACATVSGKVVLQAVILTATVVISLTLYTFWAAWRGYDFAFLFPFLYASLLVLFVYVMMQLYFPLSKVSHTIYGCVGTVVFSGFLIYDTDNLIKRHTYNEYIIAAISLYLDILNLFACMLGFSGPSSVN